MWPFDDMVAALNSMFGFLIDLVYLVFYAPMRLVDTGFNVAIGELNILIGFLNEFIALYNNVSSGIYGTFVNVWPNQYISYMLMAELTLVFAYRVYHFLKDVEIVGNKI